MNVQKTAFFVLCSVATIAGIAGELEARVSEPALPDVCDPVSLGDPHVIFADYDDSRYDNSFLDLSGQAIFKDKPSQYRCGAFFLRDGSGVGMYSTDNVLFVTDPAQRAVRSVRITSGSPDQFDQLAQSLEKKATGPGAIVRSNVKVGKNGMRGEEIRMIVSDRYRYYVDSVYLPDGRVGAVVVIRNDDQTAQAAMAAHPSQ